MVSVVPAVSYESTSPVTTEFGACKPGMIRTPLTAAGIS